jgi:sulfonate transport system substrate-binding protein
MKRSIVAFLLLLLQGVGVAHAEAVLNIAFQDAGFPALLKESGVLKEVPFRINWVLLTGPAANLSALYSGAIDVGHMGDTSLTMEQANARTEWTSANAPLKIIAAWRSEHDKRYPTLVTAVRVTSNINDLKSLKGKKWSYNYGGYNYAQYLVSLAQANLQDKDIKPLKFADGSSSAAAFSSGQSDVYSGGLGPIFQSIQKGEARILQTDLDTGIPALHVWAARKSVLDDPGKTRILEVFFDRAKEYWKWHDTHRAEAIDVLKNTLKLTQERAEVEYHLRSGAFRRFDEELFKKEQAVANTLLEAGIIKKKVDVRIGFDSRFNDTQQAIRIPD